MTVGQSLDNLIGVFSPRSALRRKQARLAIQAYEAAKPSRTHKAKREARTADTAMQAAGQSLREQARFLEENYDMARGVLSTLVNHTIGEHGIVVEPQPKTRDGEIHEEFAQQIRALLDDVSLRPEVTWRLSEPAMQRLLARSWFRDGEVFAQLLAGNAAFLDHGTRLPHSIECLESDFIPYSMARPDSLRSLAGAERVVQGIELNSWRRPVAYYVYKNLPDQWHTAEDIKRIPADYMLHLCMRDRLHQTRGVSVFASVMTRLANIRDYEESEQVAARVAAAMTSYIKRGSPEAYDPQDTTDEGARKFEVAPGMIWDNLLPGEEIGTIDSNRPSGLLTDFRGAMVRMVAAGTGATYSSTARDYNGTYSSQRQELVEGYRNYGVLGNEFSSQFVRPVYKSRVETALIAGLLTIPRNLDPFTVTDATYHSAAMPWIDPDKEAKGQERLARAGFESEEDIIRARGKRPDDVKAKLVRWRTWANENELKFSSDVAAEIPDEIEEPDDVEETQTA